MGSTFLLTQTKLKVKISASFSRELSSRGSRWPSSQACIQSQIGAWTSWRRSRSALT
ncbi:hypothetical protein F2Q69_00057944 [Brassica cretica]|uniref:Uncharacterized protein n=1 Tax=Brassica cretica TaxID=69181 RepID=A0A8S9N165_BRACR|nr:hypothetical protein F2Q69_00057944 [Brassica cretica]